MDDMGLGVLAGGHDFYLLTGTAAAAPTAPQSVAPALIASSAHRPAGAPDPERGTAAAFGSSPSRRR